MPSGSVNTRSSNGEYAGDPVENQTVDGLFGTPFESISDAFNYLLNMITGRDKQEDAQVHQEEMLDKEQANALELQQNEFDYNSESARMKRMIDAGFNVNLMAGSSGGSVGHQQAPSAPSSPIGGDGLKGALSSVLNSVMGSVNTFSEAEKRKSEIDNLNSLTFLNELESYLRPLESAEQRHLWRSESDHYASLVKLDDAQTEMLRKEADFFSKTVDLRVEDLRQQINERKEKINLYLEQEKVEQEKAKTMQKERQVMDADIALKESQGHLNYVTADKIFEEDRLIHTEREIREKDLKFIEETFGDMPTSVDFNKTIAKLYADGKTEEAEKLLNGLVYVYSQQYNAEVNNAWHNFGKEFTMQLGTSAAQSMQYVLPSFLMRGGRAGSTGGYHYMNGHGTYTPRN